MPRSCPAADEDMPRGPVEKKAGGIELEGEGGSRLASLLLDKTSIHTLLSLLNSPALACSLFLEPSLRPSRSTSLSFLLSLFFLSSLARFFGL